MIGLRTRTPESRDVRVDACGVVRAELTVDGCPRWGPVKRWILAEESVDTAGGLELLILHPDVEFLDPVGNRISVNELHVDVELDDGALGGCERLLVDHRFEFDRRSAEAQRSIVQAENHRLAGGQG